MKFYTVFQKGESAHSVAKRFDVCSREQDVFRVIKVIFGNSMHTRWNGCWNEYDETIWLKLERHGCASVLWRKIIHNMTAEVNVSVNRWKRR